MIASIMGMMHDSKKHGNDNNGGNKIYNLT